MLTRTTSPRLGFFCQCQGLAGHGRQRIGERSQHIVWRGGAPPPFRLMDDLPCPPEGARRPLRCDSRSGGFAQTDHLPTQHLGRVRTLPPTNSGRVWAEHVPALGQHCVSGVLCVMCAYPMLPRVAPAGGGCLYRHVNHDRVLRRRRHQLSCRLAPGSLVPWQGGSETGGVTCAAAGAGCPLVSLGKSCREQVCAGGNACSQRGKGGAQHGATLCIHATRGRLAQWRTQGQGEPREHRAAQQEVPPVIDCLCCGATPALQQNSTPGREKRKRQPLRPHSATPVRASSAFNRALPAACRHCC